MKKISSVVIVVLLFAAMSLSSCKSYQDCPAYGQVVEVEQNAKA